MTAIAATPVQTLRVADLHTTLFNPRSPDVAKAAGLPVSEAFSEAKLRALGASIASPTGQLEAILVRPHPTKPGAFEVADGERRYRAAVLCGIETLAAKVRDLSDAEMVEIALATGTGDHVESLTALEEAAGYRRLKELRGFSDRQLADHLRRDVLYVTRRLALLELPLSSAKALQAGELPVSTAYLIASIPGETERLEAEKSILNSELHGGIMPRRAAVEFIADKICRSLKAPAFDMKDATLLPEAGACTGCRFRAGNNPDEYGHVVDPVKGGGVDKCMHPACYRKKEEAHRARVVTKVAVDGKQALTQEENARAFPADERGLHYSSEFVPYEQRPTPDLLKKEVAPSSAPTWRELVEGGAAKVQIYVGVHQDGHAVDLVKRHEAIAAADVNERRIFAETEVKRAAERLDRGDSIAAADRAAQHETAQRSAAEQSRAAQEKAESDARKKAEKAQKKKDKASRAWLAELLDTLATTRGPKAWQHLPYWTLLYEMAAAPLTPEEIAMVMLTVDEDCAENERDRAALDAYAGELGVPWLAALTTIMLLLPKVRAVGADSELVKEWHQAIIATPDVETEEEAQEREEAGDEECDAPKSEIAAREIAGRSAQKQRELKEIAKAHADGINVLEIARSYGRPVADVCGMLEVPVPDGVPDLPAHCAPYQVREIIGYDNEAKTIEEMAYLMHRDRAWVRQVLLACGRDSQSKDEAAEVLRLSTEVQAMLEAAGHSNARQRDNVAKLACKKKWADCSTVEDLAAVKACIERVTAAKAKKPASASGVEAEQEGA